jgi:hypothetical protein
MHELRERRNNKQPEILRSGRNLELISYRSAPLSDVNLQLPATLRVLRCSPQHLQS